MRRIILFISVFTLMISSCSDDDQPKDPFIGTWLHYSFSLNGEESRVNSCDDKDIIVVYADGDLKLLDYVGLATCFVENEYLGTWANKGEKFYLMSYDNGYIKEDEITFESNTFSIETIVGEDTIIDVWRKINYDL